LIKRRHVIYVHGYDPQGAAGYYRLFEREWKKFKTTWSVTSDLGKLEIDSDDFAHWTITTSGPNWTVETRYDFLRYDDALKANLSQPLYRQVPRALRWFVDDLVTGTTARIIRATWRFWLHLFIPQLGLLLWLAVAATAGWFAAKFTLSYLALPFIVAFLLGAVAAVLVFLALRPIAERWLIIRLNNAWPHMHEFGRGEPTFYDRPIAACAARIKEAAADESTDEVLVIGHSGGGLIAPSMLARALELDPDLGKHGPRVALMTLGSLFPAVALHPRAESLRNVVRRLATEPSIRWIDCQSRKDVMNFWEFDLVKGLGIDLDAPRHNPLLWPVRFRDIVSEQYYQHLRRNLLRLHYQFIMSGDLRAPYNFFMLTCGPLPAEEWAARTWGALEEFSSDTAYRAGTTSAPEARAALRTSEG
jgi:hypothetical protein